MSGPTPRVLLATFCLRPGGEAGGDLLVSALADRGVDAAWAVWDDAAVDWAAADLVAVRATWDYSRRVGPFLAWVRAVAERGRLLNGVDAIVWNHDKAYLDELGRHVPTVPGVLVADDDLVGGLEEALGRFGEVVVKPRVGAGGIGVVVADHLGDGRLAGLTAGPWLAQPLVASVRERGETSVMVVDGRPVVQVDKRPAGGDIRVHERYGGGSVRVALTEEAGALAVQALEAAGTILGHRLDYGRVDLLELDGRLVVSELELIEPSLYLDVAPETAYAFADLVVDRLGA